MTILDPLTLADPARLMAGGNVHTTDVLKSIAKRIRDLTMSHSRTPAVDRHEQLLRLARQIDRLASTMDAEAS